MSQSVPPASEQPEPAPAPEAEPAADAAESEPLNRAERRAKAKKADPNHVGPSGELARQVRGARPHSKRPR